jgi:hypothetical protein
MKSICDAQYKFGPYYFVRALSVFVWLYFFQGKLLENKINEMHTLHLSRRPLDFIYLPV